MKISIISDIHENFHNLILALQDMEQSDVDHILCLGDLINPGIAKVLATQSIPVFMIWGNNDGDRVEITLASKMDNSQLTVSARTFDFINLGGKNIFLTHYEDLAVPMAKSGDFDAVFFGHNHIQSSQKLNNCWVINPGELAASKTNLASYALYDTDDDSIQFREIQDSVSLKTPVMERYFKEYGHRMALRSNKAFGLSEDSIISKSSSVYKTLTQSAQKAKVVVFSGLPGVGKSFYIHKFKKIAADSNRRVHVIQWDIARKAFETPSVLSQFPMKEGQVHDGVKLCAGFWLLETLSDWIASHDSPKELLLIEAPLVGHRFVELAQKQDDDQLEGFLKSDQFHVIVPIPSKKVRAKIEETRATQVSDDAKVWSGAKPSVMLALWKMICEIANSMGKNIPLDKQPPYDPDIYEFVYKKVLKHRHFIPLYIDEIYETEIQGEHQLHPKGSLVPDQMKTSQYAENLLVKHTSIEEISKIVSNWFNT